MTLTVAAIPSEAPSLDADRRRRHRGSGLGLTLAKRPVLAHVGEAEAASEPGEGTPVTFTLPR